MNNKVVSLIFSFLFCCILAFAQESQQSSLQQRAEAEGAKGNVAAARFNYIRAYEDYAAKGQLRKGVECAVKATALYYRENLYKEAFDLLRRVDQNIYSAKHADVYEASQACQCPRPAQRHGGSGQFSQRR